MTDFFESARKYGFTGPQEKPKNKLDLILDESKKDLARAKLRHHTLINSDDPHATLKQFQSTENSVKDEDPGIRKKVLNNTYSTQLTKDDPEKAGFYEGLWYSLAEGSARLGQGMASFPGFIYSFVSIPQNYLAKLPGLEFLDNSATAEYLTNNPVAKYYKDLSGEYREVNNRYDKQIVDYIKEGKLDSALGLTAQGIVGSIPYTASLIAGGMYGVPAKLMVPTVTVVSGGEKLGTLMEEQPSMDFNVKVMNALVDGMAEGVFEQMGSAGIGRTLRQLSKDLYKQVGKEEGEKILKKTIFEVFKNRTNRFIALKSANQEGLEEFSTTVMQNLNAQLTGEDPNRDLFQGAIDSYIVGAGAGYTITKPSAMAINKQNKQREELGEAIEYRKGVREKVLSAMDPEGEVQLEDVTDQEFKDFVSTLSKEEQMEMGIEEDLVEGGYKVEKDTIIQRQMKKRSIGKLKEMKDPVATKAKKDLIKYYQDKDNPLNQIKDLPFFQTLMDEVDEGVLTIEQARQKMIDAGLGDESDPAGVTVHGKTVAEFTGKVRKAVSRIFAGQEPVTVVEEEAEKYYKAMAEIDPNFESKISEWRNKYDDKRYRLPTEEGEKGTWEKPGEQEQQQSDLEWFSDRAVEYAMHNKLPQKAGTQLRKILDRFAEYARVILRQAHRLRREIKAGNVSEDLIQALEEATTPEAISKKVTEASEAYAKKVKTKKKKGPSYRLTEKYQYPEGMKAEDMAKIPRGEQKRKLSVGESNEVQELAKDIFGTTEDPREAGYILNDGTMLDFSGKNEGGSSGMRNYDHREINRVGDDTEGVGGDPKWDDVGMNEFIDSGAIRWMPESNAFNFMGIPENAQWAQIREMVINDAGLVNPEYIQVEAETMGARYDERFYSEYDKGTPYETIKRDILNYFRGGKGPSITQQFHSSYRLSIEKGLEKLRTKPALRSPGKTETLTKSQIKVRVKRIIKDTLPRLLDMKKNRSNSFKESLTWYGDDFKLTINIAP